MYACTGFCLLAEMDSYGKEVGAKAAEHLRRQCTHTAALIKLQEYYTMNVDKFTTDTAAEVPGFVGTSLCGLLMRVPGFSALIWQWVMDHTCFPVIRCEPSEQADTRLRDYAAAGIFQGIRSLDSDLFVLIAAVDSFAAVLVSNDTKSRGGFKACIPRYCALEFFGDDAASIHPVRAMVVLCVVPAVAHHVSNFPVCLCWLLQLALCAASMGCDIDRKGVIGMGWVRSVEAVLSTVATLKASGGLEIASPLVCAAVLSHVMCAYLFDFICYAGYSGLLFGCMRGCATDSEDIRERRCCATCRPCEWAWWRYRQGYSRNGGATLYVCLELVRSDALNDGSTCSARSTVRSCLASCRRVCILDKERY